MRADARRRWQNCAGPPQTETEIAGSAGAQDRKYWGAIAESLENRDWGFSYRFNNSKAASDAAIGYCRSHSGATDCRTFATFANQCAALVRSGPTGFVALGSSEGLAAFDALTHCREKHSDCQFHFAFCTWREPMKGEGERPR